MWHFALKTVEKGRMGEARVKVHFGSRSGEHQAFHEMVALGIQIAGEGWVRER
jgi:hypothetical protein